MAVTYKTLFEIKLMHEYFLTREDGTVVFSEPDPTKRLDFLVEEFMDDKPAINDDILFEFPENRIADYEKFFLKLLPSYSGCRVVVRVHPKLQADQSVLYEPMVPLPDDLHIFILLTPKNLNTESYSNARVRRAFPSIYFFSNTDTITPRTFPFLTNAVAVQDSSTQYEQGELTLSATNVVQEYFNTGGADDWYDLPGNGFANESDRLLLPESFEYSFSNATNLTQAEFVLKDFNGNEVQTIPVSNASGISSKISLDFSGKTSAPDLVSPNPLREYVYNLEVNGNNGYTGKHNVIFSNELANSRPWAVVAIKTVAPNAAFNLYAADGFLVNRKNAPGSPTLWNPAPTFEIPVTSRFAYWRFINNKDRELLKSLTLTDYVDKEDKVLITKKPRSVAKHWFLLRKTGTTDTVYVPNPVFTEIKSGSDRRLFLDVRVPESDLFPVVP